MPPLALLLALLLAAAETALTTSPAPSASPFSGLLLSCGAAAPFVDSRGLQWIPDSPYVSDGKAVNLTIPGLLPELSTLRSFPFSPSSALPHKYCFYLPAKRNTRYLIRATFFYGQTGPPPAFDLILDATFWTTVNTSAEYAAGEASYYESVYMALGKSVSLCVAGNPAYTVGNPFVSAIEFVGLPNSVYNATDFSSYAMGLIARSRFGFSGLTERYPDDIFDRYWQPYTDAHHALSSVVNVTASDFWNLPPANVFSTALVANGDTPLVLRWPAFSLQNSSYYIALYFADTSPNNTRTFDVYINDYNFYKGLTVTSSGLSVFATQWILSGATTVILTPDGNLPPLINAGEVFGLFPVGRLALARDVVSLQSIRRELNNAPDDWNGDPCLPLGYSWTGVTCDEGPRIRVVSLNLSSMGLSGSLSPSIADLTALSVISFANNNLSGPIPDLINLKLLQTLDLQNNHFNGTIPSTMGNMSHLHNLYLQNNDLSGPIPANLLNKPGLNVQLSPGNNFTASPTGS